MTDQTSNPSNPNNSKPYQYKISRLNNSHHFAYQLVLIIEVEVDELYRIIGYRKNRMVFDCLHASLRGSKIFFTKCCQHFETSNIEIKAEWTDFYSPENDWIEELNIKPISETKKAEVMAKKEKIKRYIQKKKQGLDGVPQ